MPSRRSIEALPLRARWLLASALLVGWLLTAAATAAAVSIPDRPADAGSKAATPELPRLPSEPPVTTPDLPPPPDLPDPPPAPEPPPLPVKPSKPTPPPSLPDTPAAATPEKAPAGGTRAPDSEAGGGKAPARLPRLPVEAPRSASHATDDVRAITEGGSRKLPAGGRGVVTPTGADAAGSRRDAGGGSATPNGPTSGTSERELQQGTVGSAEPAPLQRLIARVWPAFALLPADTVVALLEGRMGAAIARLPVVAEMLRRIAPEVALASTRVGEDARPAAQVSTSPPTGDSLTGWITDEDRLPLLVAVALCGALILLLVAAVRRDLREMSRYRWRH
jgi:hypothetical protein